MRMANVRRHVAGLSAGVVGNWVAVSRSALTWALERSANGVGTSPRPALPRIGLECAGIVTAVGEKLSGVSVGDEVIVYPVTGAYADYVVATTGSLISKPHAVDWPVAGGLMLAGTTAAHTLHAAGVRPGDHVLIHGGSGGVG